MVMLRFCFFSLSSSTFYVVLIHRVAYLDVTFVLWFWSFLVAAMGSRFVQSYVVVTRNFYLYMRLIVVRCRASKTFPRVSMCVRDSGSQMDLKYVTNVRFNFKYTAHLFLPILKLKYNVNGSDVNSQYKKLCVEFMVRMHE